MTVIETENLTKKFGTLIAVNSLNLGVQEGEIFGLIGPNGSGKTTTIKMLCGLLLPTSGTASVLGRTVPDKRITRSIGYMPQEMALYVGLTVHQNIELYGKIFGFKKDEIDEREKMLLKFINLEKWRDILVENLSGGMRHRVSLVCALIHHPHVLFLDEPTVGVDPELRASFWNYFNDLKERNTTILLTTHYMDEASHCDRVGFMKRGGLIAEGTPQELLDATGTDSLEDAFLKCSLRGEER